MNCVSEKMFCKIHAVRYSIFIEDVHCHVLSQDSAEPIALKVYRLYSGLIIFYLIPIE